MAVTRATKPNYVLVFTGLILILVATAISVFVCPLTNANMYILRVLMAIGSTLLLTLVGPSIKIENKLVKASGAIAFGVLIFLINPPKLINEDNQGCRDEPLDVLRGTVFLNGKTVSGAQVLLIGSNQLQQITDPGGNFTFQVKRKELEETTSFQIDGVADTVHKRTFNTDSILNRKIEIRIRVPKILDGYVWNADGDGIERVRILVGRDTTYTDDGGHFRLELESADNSVPVNFSKKGYKSATMPITLPNKDVSITLNK
jgi:hypothetical protein